MPTEPVLPPRRPRTRLIGGIVAVVAAAVVGLVALRPGGGMPAASPAASIRAAAGSGAASGTSSTAGQGPLPGSVAVVGSDGALSLVHASGEVSVLSGEAGFQFGFPTWSPDGTRVASVRATSGETAIVVFDAVTGAGAASPTIIYRSSAVAPFYLSWSPDSRSVSFLASESDGLSLRVAPADGSAPLDGSGPGTVLRRGAPLYFDWIRPDRLLIHVGLGADAVLGEVGLDAAPPASPIADSGDFRSAIVSHDRNYLSYVRATGDGPGEVVVAARDGSAEHTAPASGPTAVLFSPVDDVVAVIGGEMTDAVSAAFPFGPLRLIDARSGAIRPLLDGTVVAGFWSPDGSTIAAIRLQDVGGPTADRGGIVLAADVQSPSPSPRPSATEVRLLFVDVASGDIRSERVVRLGSRFVNELLPYFDQYALSHRLWAPDGSAIVLPLVDDTGRTSLAVLPPDGSDAPRTIDGEIGFWSP
ncbi:MAG: hypothetical protein H0V73_07015 [Chloroflexi bacterium]|nr:hypothetical protein [Chloroflexota bacterium]